MDSDLLKTFIEVARVRHFGKAAARLHITQSAVSARIRLLEQEVGRPLFLRTRNNIQLTSYGEKFIDHVREIMAAWDKARASLAMEENFHPTFRIGGVSSLWEDSLMIFLQRIHQELKGYDLSAIVDDHDNLIAKLLTRKLDICFSYDGLPLPKLASSKIGEIELQLFSAEPDLDTAKAAAMDHIMVDWGKELMIHCDKLGLSLSRPTLRTNSARLALDFALHNGGTLFLPKTFAAAHQKGMRLFAVSGIDPYRCPVYGHFLLEDEDETLIKNGLELSREVLRS